MSEDKDFIDWDTFNQVKEMDDEDDDNSFLVSLVGNFFEQAVSTFNTMDKALEEKDLVQLSSLGHFIKGSSAALGFKNIQSECEKIQHLGAGKDETGTTEVVDDDEGQLDRIATCLKTAREEYAKVKDYMDELYPSISAAAE
ncbi:phosphorelay intermediate protein Ypd1p [Trichomonascus vanleenenianus]|uniref:Ypd1p n=1 Tax=Trichomonascus vanleenenianus TaxID=2268995 RepID=UPI003ECB1FE3